jgi:hypothetical protein
LTVYCVKALEFCFISAFIDLNNKNLNAIIIFKIYLETRKTRISTDHGWSELPEIAMGLAGIKPENE